MKNILITEYFILFFYWLVEICLFDQENVTIIIVSIREGFMKDKSLLEDIKQAVYTSVIDKDHISKQEYQPTLVYNDYYKGFSVLSSIEKELKNSDEFWFSVAFVTKDGIACLKQILLELEEKNIKGRILTTNYLSFNDPLALEELLLYKNIEVKIFQGSFHTKGYIFKKKSSISFISGSSNLTQTALKNNKEWNIKISSLQNGKLVNEAIDEFNSMWNSTSVVSLSQSWIDDYKPDYDLFKTIQLNNTYTTHKILLPNRMQTEALKALKDLRSQNKNKGMLISSTGTGKTYLSAFDAQNFKPRKFLFVVHREQILIQAEESYKRVFGNTIKTGFLSGTRKELDADYLFATLQSLSKDDTLEYFPEDYFDMIVYDEVHRSGSSTYEKIINHFKPKFMLGMSATPERTDGKDIFSLFDYNIAYEIRLLEAMEAELLCPFHYFGITDIEIDGQVVDESVTFNQLVSDDRVNYILEKANYYGYSGNKIHGLVFCSRKEEAHELATKFTEKGVPSLALTGEDSQERREHIIKRLERKKGDPEAIDYIFTVDIFNEGIDIPCINQIIMIRSTKSSIIFTQQLGRGLRKFDGKDYVVILDFIGNYNNNYLIPIALSGDRTYNKDNLRKHVHDGSNLIPGCSTIHFDRISRNRILESIQIENFSVITKIMQAYTELKQKIGRIPSLDDYHRFGYMDIMRIIENKTFGSYYNFLVKKEKEYTDRISDKAKNMLEFVQQKLMYGKRVEELLVLDSILNESTDILQELKTRLKNYHKELTPNEITTIYRVLSNQFVVSKNMLPKFKHAIFINQDFSPTFNFLEELNDPIFRELLKESVTEGIKRFEEQYSNRYYSTNFVLNQKYSYEDVCRLLNWEQNIVSLNIGGYKYDDKTNTLPIFINYDKEDDISDSIKYHDHFITNAHLLWLTKSNRTRHSPEVIRIFDKINPPQIYLFVRKNKNDKGEGSKEFYFLGHLSAIDCPHQTTLANGSSVVEIQFKLKNPVKDDLYSYIVGED